MTYTAEIKRANPTCFLFVIDQSGSMADPFPGETKETKAERVSTMINRLLQNLVIKCARDEGVRDYFHIGVIGYGGTIGPAFIGPLAGKELVPISEVADNPARLEERAKKVDDGAGGLVDQTVKLPIWFDPVANNGTPMCQALELARKVVSGWLAQHPSCFPPVAIHITDGESTDGDPSGQMRELTKLASADGEVILLNIHLSNNPAAKPVEFPDSSEGLPDQYARMLFEGASLLTANMRAVAASDYKLELADNAKGFVLNADPQLVITALDIGTRPSNLR